MKTFAATLFAAICITSDALALQEAVPDQYAMCKFNRANPHWRPVSSPKLDATLAIKFDGGTDDVVVSFGFEGGDKNTEYALDLISFIDTSGLNEKKCSGSGSTDLHIYDFFTGKTEQNGDFKMQKRVTDTFTMEDVRDEKIVAEVRDWYGLVACCIIREEHSVDSYNDAFHDLIKI